MKILFAFCVLCCGCAVFTPQPSEPNDATDPHLHRVLLFRWKVPPDTAARAEMMRLFAGLPAKVDGFESVEWVELQMSSDSFDVAVMQIFRTEAAVRSYETHPDHQRIAQIGPPLLRKFEKFSYWTRD